MTSYNLKTDFDEIFKKTIIPFFKDLSFKRKAQDFARAINDITQAFNVQKSKWNSYGDGLSFTFNLGFYNQKIHDLALEEDTSIGFPKITDCFIQERLGTFSHKSDYWYELNKTIDKVTVANQVRSDLEKFLLPIFDNYKSLADLKQFVDKKEKNTGLILPPAYQIIFLMTTNQIDRGKITIKENYKKALTPQVSTQTINYPDGRSEVTTSKPYVNQNFINDIKRLAKLYEVEL